MFRLRFLAVLLLSSSFLACGDDGFNATPDASIDAPGTGVVDPTDPDRYTAPEGEELAFGVEEGNIRNYFYRRGSVAVHLLARSGESPRVIAAFPAGNQGIGIWFQDVDAPGAELSVTGDIAAGGDMTGVVRQQADDPRPLHGVRATLASDASSLQVKLSLLANVRTVRDYGYGFDFSTAPELTNNDIELIAEHNVARVSRVQVGGDHHMEYLIKGLDDTQVAVGDDGITLQASAGVRFELIVLSDEDPLTPIDLPDLLTDTPGDSYELKALAFLTYAEKLQAGSWRFLTYFGRDTLLSVRMLMPALQPEVVEAGLSSVIERINLAQDVVDPTWGFTVDVGDVSHEEELADYAAWKNSKDDPPPADLRTPRYDYKMIDDDFLLAPVLALYMEQYPERAVEFLARTRELDGASYQSAIESNLQLVLDRAAPYADPLDADNPLNLVSLRDSVPVGEWRDSNEGLGFGRYAFNINVALVPAALEGAVTLYTQLGVPDKIVEAEILALAWTDIDEHFLVTLPQAEAQTRVTGYADSVMLDNSVAGEIAADLEYHAISLDSSGAAVPVMHTDHGFVMLFTDPSDTYLQRIAQSITRTFPAGLFSDVGVMVANPAFAGDAMVTNPSDGTSVPVADIFTLSHYHGSVVWSWQQAMLAAGVRRQLAERSDLTAQTVTALEGAECALWHTINKANEVRAGELWTWEAVAGKPEYRFFGYNRDDVDESNAAQLWSTVYLAVQPPADFETRCAATVAP